MNKELSTALGMLEEAGEIALRYFRSGVAVDNKRGDAGFDPVTAADRDVEQMIRRRLREQFGNDSVIGEEFGPVGDMAGRFWIIDPIDGTRAFISGQLGWGILLGLYDGEQPLLGCMAQPYTSEIFCGYGDSARLLRGSQQTELRVSDCSKVSDAIIYTTDPSMFDSESEEFLQQVRRSARLHRYGGDCYNYCLLAAGSVDAVVENDLQPYDILPLVPIIQAAGGVVTDSEGRIPMDGGLVVAAATPQLHEQLLAMIQAE